MIKVIIEGYIIVPNSDLESVKSALDIHRTLTLRETGCLTFEVTEDGSNPNKFIFHEEFINQSAFDSHQARTKSSKWAEVSKNVERNFKRI